MKGAAPHACAYFGELGHHGFRLRSRTTPVPYATGLVTSAGRRGQAIVDASSPAYLSTLLGTLGISPGVRPSRTDTDIRPTRRWTSSVTTNPRRAPPFVLVAVVIAAIAGLTSGGLRVALLATITPLLVLALAYLDSRKFGSARRSG